MENNILDLRSYAKPWRTTTKEGKMKCSKDENECRRPEMARDTRRLNNVVAQGIGTVTAVLIKTVHVTPIMDENEIVTMTVTGIGTANVTGTPTGEEVRAPWMTEENEGEGADLLGSAINPIHAAANETPMEIENKIKKEVMTRRYHCLFVSRTSLQ